MRYYTIFLLMAAVNGSNHATSGGSNTPALELKSISSWSVINPPAPTHTNQFVIKFQDEPVTKYQLEHLPRFAIILHLIRCGLKDLDVAALPQGLKTLILEGNELTELDLTKLPPTLEWLHLGGNKLKVADLTQLPQGLKVLDLVDNELTEVDLSQLPSGMYHIIAMFFGVTDITLLICIAMSNATMCILGLFQEKYNNIRDPDAVIDWLPFCLICFIGIAPWIVVYTYLGFAEDQPPNFVYGILVGYFVFFNTFPGNMILQYKRIGPWRDYIFGETGYIVLSLASKTMLGWLVFGGLNQPNKYT